MRIAKVETMIVDIPFVDGGKGEGIGPTTWNKLEFCLVRLEDDRGNVGWGEGFGYFVTDATKAVIDRMIAPLLAGTSVTDIPAWNQATQRRLHLFGRYGITMYAISAVDMALWDLAAKREGVPLHRLLSETRRGSPAGGAAGGYRAEPAGAGPAADGSSVGSVRSEISFYASLVRYGDAVIAPRVCENALKEGFTDLKLHEITLPDIEACRHAVGAEAPVSVDVNCNWSPAAARDAIPALIDLGVSWLEEPTFPPEGFAELAALRGRGLPVAAGENWCTVVQFADAVQAGAIDLAQPSVTKVGGVSEFLMVADLCAGAGIELLPHCPYFGPGMFASLHLAAALPGVRQLEWLYVQPDAWLASFDHLRGGERAGGFVGVPDQPGLGFEPDPVVMQRYRRA